MYTRITAAERYLLARLCQHRIPMAIPRLLGRHPSALYRWVRRNTNQRDGGYRSELPRKTRYRGDRRTAKS